MRYGHSWHKAAAYCLNFAPELALHYGGTPAQELQEQTGFRIPARIAGARPNL